MKIKKPSFWDRKEASLLAYLLYPVSQIYRFLNNINNQKKEILTSLENLEFEIANLKAA